MIGSYRSFRGGSSADIGNYMRASIRFFYPTGDHDRLGFRVSEVPEPATIVMLAFGGVGVSHRRKR